MTERGRHTFWTAMGWGFTFGVGVSLYLRWSTVHSPAGVLLVSLVPLLVPALIVLFAAAWITRSALLRIATLILVVGYFVTYPTVGSLIGCRGETAEDQVVVYSHNVRYQHGDPALVAQAAGTAGADVMVLQEVWPAFVEGLDAQPDSGRFRYRATEAVDGATGLAVWSRWPIRDATLEDLGGVPLMRMVVQAPQGPFILTAVHTSAPKDRLGVSRWEEQLARLAERPVTGPSVMAGDFNATTDHRQFRAVLDGGWTDVNQPKGCGFDTTWPVGRYTGVPIMRLDHVLVSPDFQVLAVDVGPAGGSDHASVVTRVVLRPEPTG